MSTTLIGRCNKSPELEAIFSFHVNVHASLVVSRTAGNGYS
jgi:hypothetical protein